MSAHRKGQAFVGLSFRTGEGQRRVAEGAIEGVALAVLVGGLLDKPLPDRLPDWVADWIQFKTCLGNDAAGLKNTRPAAFPS
ncbi:hypothetical protein [Bradyrhizobium sp. 33ap4]|uniref:hypothetical protein n=1 Tax=Bradyrhizobium sp. 33ap4 TaxID=3061630 RepID=UPI0029310F71|nr:hypothetical protein [Bradyrhizobium sp. 33ap4]